MADRKPLLELRTLAERAFITIDDAKYELKHVGELSILDQFRVERQQQELAALTARAADKSMGDPDVQGLRASLDEMVRMVLIAPSAIVDGLTDWDKLSVVAVFGQLLPGKTAPARPAAAAAPPATKTSRARAASARRRPKPTGES